MTENEIAKEVVDAAIKVHMALGPGLLESVFGEEYVKGGIKRIVNRLE
ncbi:MAG: GxxExxY protein [Fimbriimonas sp.]|nr:GxxExxY protein [Fimbriimonas sp.]